jgi:hypothetical protein
LADIFTPLADLPVWMQWWRKRALKYQEHQNQVWMQYWSELRGKMEKGRAPECFVKQLLDDDPSLSDLDEMQGAYLAGCTPK